MKDEEKKFEELVKVFSKSKSSRNLLNKEDRKKLDVLLKDQVLTEKEYKKILKEDDLKTDEKKTIKKIENLKIENFIKEKFSEIKLDIRERKEIKVKKSFKNFIQYIIKYFKTEKVAENKTEYFLKKEIVEKIDAFVNGDIESLFNEYKKEKLEVLKETYEILGTIKKKTFEENLNKEL